jgi:formyltetrahydrofolate deformylase
MKTSHILTLTLPDAAGIVHAVSCGLLDIGGNILESAQFGDPCSRLFCLRTVVETACEASEDVAAAVAAKLAAAGHTEQVRLEVRRADWRPRILIMVSRFDHCLVDLLYRWKNGLLPVEIPAIVSNHPDAEPIARSHGIPFHHLPITPETKPAQEARLLELLNEYRIDLVVLARYMQVLSNELCQKLQGRAINIHHSFLPGFKGAKPYHQAAARGVKLIGATAHFVTPDLDEGPIIEQDVARVTHAHTIEQIIALGQDTERLVLARAVRLWAEDRVLMICDRTVVFT